MKCLASENESGASLTSSLGNSLTSSNPSWNYVKKVKAPMYSPFLQNIDQALGVYNQVHHT